MMKRTALYIFLALLTASCSITRYVPDGDMLYTGIESVEFTDAEENAAGTVGKTALQEARYALDYAPNGAIAGSSTLRALPIGLWWYNALRDSDNFPHLDTEQAYAFFLFFLGGRPPRFSGLGNIEA